MCSSQLCKAWMFIEFRLQFGVFFRIYEMHTTFRLICSLFLKKQNAIVSIVAFINLIIFFLEWMWNKDRTLFNYFCFFTLINSKTWNEPGLRFGLFWVVRGSVLEDKPRFEVRNFQVCSNIPKGKFAHFFYSMQSEPFLVQGLVLFGRFEFRFQRTNLGSEGSRFGFLNAREVWGLVFSGSFQV